MTEKTSTGLKKETAAAISYVLGPITGIILLLLEKDPFIRFHAMQSIIVLGALIVLQFALTVTVILSALVPLVSLVSFVLWLLLMYKASQGEKWKAPVLGDYVERFL